MKGGLKMNPFEQKPIKMEDGIMDWASMYPMPYDKRTEIGRAHV